MEKAITAIGRTAVSSAETSRKPANGEEFRQLMSSLKSRQQSAASTQGKAPELHAAAKEMLSEHLDSWRVAEANTNKLLKRLPKEGQDILKAQFLVQRLHYQSLMAARAGEAFSGTIRRVQQMA